MGGTRTRRNTWVALLRGINLGARNKVSMAELHTLFSELDAENVATYVQSGNVVFAHAGPREKVRKGIEQEIRSRLGLDIAVLLRTRGELGHLVAGNPFAGEEKDAAKLHVTFLAERPNAKRARSLAERRFEPDDFHVAGDAVYLHCPKGYGRSKLSNAFFEKELGVTATTRNWRTVTALAELAAG